MNNHITRLHKTYAKVALFGGIYNNHIALEEACQRAKAHGCEALFQQGDLGGFGPFPNKVFPILEKYNVQCLQGNYEESLMSRLTDCGCGYTHPRDNHFAQISYDYTDQNLSEENRQLLSAFPKQIQFKLGGLTVHLCHGSPRRVNEFLWESTTADGFITRLAKDIEFDILCCTHTGIPWKREVAPNKWIVNIGVLGRPANNGKRSVQYVELTSTPDGPLIEFINVEYDWKTLAKEMESEKLPPEFIETITTGYWTTCLEILPGKERAFGKY